MNDLVSVIIPIYNSAQYLSRCLDSVISQNYTSIEIILINDGSTDSSKEICEQYLLKDKRIVLINTENHGVSSARNTGIKHSGGKYITFIDSDDYVDRTIVSCLCQCAYESSSDLVISSLDETEDHNPFSIEISSDHISEMMFLLRNYLVFGPTQKLYRADIIKKNGVCFPEEFSYGEDILFNIDYLKHINTVTYLNRVLYHYERGANPDSLSHKHRWNMYRNDMFINAALKSWLEERELLNDDAVQFLSDRIFDTACNSACLPFEKHSPWKLNELPAYYKSIINNPLLDWASLNADVSAYPGWLVSMILKKRGLFLTCAAVLKRRFR